MLHVPNEISQAGSEQATGSPQLQMDGDDHGEGYVGSMLLASEAGPGQGNADHGHGPDQKSALTPQKDQAQDVGINNKDTDLDEARARIQALELASKEQEKQIQEKDKEIQTLRSDLVSYVSVHNSPWKKQRSEDRTSASVSNVPNDKKRAFK